MFLAQADAWNRPVYVTAHNSNDELVGQFRPYYSHTYSLACELTHSLTYLLGAGIANEETELKEFRGTANGTSENPVSEYGLRETDHGNASDDDDEEEEEQISFRRNYEEIRF